MAIISNLTTASKISLLCVLVVIAVVAVVIPILAMRGSPDNSTPTTTISSSADSIEVLRTIQAELENLKLQLKASLGREDKEAVPVQVSAGRHKRQTVAETTKTQVDVRQETGTTLGETTVASISTQTQEGDGKAAEQVDRTQTFEQVVDGIIGVLDVLHRTKEDIVNGLTQESNRGFELSRKIYTGTETIRNTSMITTAEKQLARDLLARIETDEEDISNTIRLLETGQISKDVPDKIKTMATKLAALNIILLKIETSLKSQLSITSPSSDATSITSVGSSTNISDTMAVSSTEKTLLDTNTICM